MMIKCVFNKIRKYPYFLSKNTRNSKQKVARPYLRVVGTFLHEFLFSRLKCIVIMMLGYRLNQQTANEQIYRL
jgi:hypothetical protein